MRQSVNNDVSKDPPIGERRNMLIATQCCRINFNLVCRVVVTCPFIFFCNVKDSSDIDMAIKILRVSSDDNMCAIDV